MQLGRVRCVRNVKAENSKEFHSRASKGYISPFVPYLACQFSMPFLGDCVFNNVAFTVNCVCGSFAWTHNMRRGSARRKWAEPDRFYWVMNVDNISWSFFEWERLLKSVSLKSNNALALPTSFFLYVTSWIWKLPVHLKKKVTKNVLIVNHIFYQNLIKCFSLYSLFRRKMYY